MLQDRQYSSISSFAVYQSTKTSWVFLCTRLISPSCWYSLFSQFLHAVGTATAVSGLMLKLMFSPCTLSTHFGSCMEMTKALCANHGFGLQSFPPIVYFSNPYVEKVLCSFCLVNTTPVPHMDLIASTRWL